MVQNIVFDNEESADEATFIGIDCRRYDGFRL